MTLQTSHIRVDLTGSLVNDHGQPFANTISPAAAATIGMITGELTDVQYSGSSVTQFTRAGIIYTVSYASSLVSTIVGSGYTWTFTYSGVNLTSVLRT